MPKTKYFACSKVLSLAGIDRVTSTKFFQPALCFTSSDLINFLTILFEVTSCKNPFFYRRYKVLGTSKSMVKKFIRSLDVKQRAG